MTGSSLDSLEWVEDWLLVEDREVVETSLSEGSASILKQEVLSIHKLLHMHRIPLKEMEWKFLRKRLVIVAVAEVLVVLIIPGTCHHTLDEIADMECVRTCRSKSSPA